MMRFIASRMEMKFWGRATRGIFLSSSTVDLESLNVLSDLEKNSSGTQGTILVRVH